MSTLISMNFLIKQKINKLQMSLISLKKIFNQNQIYKIYYQIKDYQKLHKKFKILYFRINIIINNNKNMKKVFLKIFMEIIYQIVNLNKNI